MPDHRSFRSSVNRRQFVAGASAAVMATTTGRALAQTPSPGASPSGGQDILHSSMEGVPDAVLRAPEPFTSYDGTPANGGTVRFTHLIYGPPATPHDDNQFWQEVEKRLGLEHFEVVEIPVAAYEEKISALIAGNDMGDLLYLNAGEGGAAIINSSLQEGAFTDLTDELTGDNLQKYPNLARLPQAMWDQSKVNGKIFGVPNPIYQGSNMTFYRQDWMDTLGTAELGTSDDVLAMFDAFRNGDPDGNGKGDTWAMGWSTANFINGMFRCPNGWRKNDDGTLTNIYETDEWIQAIEFRKTMWDQGVIHPDAASNTQQQMRDLFLSGRTGAMSEGFGTWWGKTGTIESLREQFPDANLQPIMPFGFDGGDAYTYPLPAYYGTVAIPYSAGEDADRVEELLRICDYMYPPFGSEEYNLLTYGIDGVHNEPGPDNAHILTTKGEADISGLLYGFVARDLYIYYPGFPDHAKRQQQLVELTKPLNLANPTQGLYSEKNTDLGPKITQIITDATDNYVYGRGSLDDLKAAVERWRNEGGDEIRAEFEDLLS